MGLSARLDLLDMLIANTPVFAIRVFLDCAALAAGNALGVNYKQWREHLWATKPEAV